MKYLIQEIIKLLVIFIVVSSIAFTILYYLPGSSEQINRGFLGTSISETQSAENLKVDTSLQDNTTQIRSLNILFNSYVTWLMSVMQGEMGRSEYSGEAITSILIPRLLLSLTIAFITIILSVLCSICLVWIYDKHVLHSSKLRSIVDKLISVLELLILSFIPLSFSIFIFKISSDFGVSFLDVPLATKIFFPILSLIILNIPLYTRSFAKSMKQVATLPFVKFARTLGYSEDYIWWREKLPNSIIFTLSLSVTQLSYFVGGIIIVEKIFLVPGLGSGLIDAVVNRENNIVLTIIVLVSLIVSTIHSLFSYFKIKFFG